MNDNESISSELGLDEVSEIATLLSGDESEEVAETPEDDEANVSDSESSQEESEKESEPEQDTTWAGVLGVDDNAIVLDDEGNLKGLVVKVDGEQSTVSVKDLIAGYQINKHVTQKSQALSADRQEFESMKDQVVRVYAEKLKTADKLVDHLQKTLLSDFDGVNWDTLRAQNPGEYAALLEDFKYRKDQIGGIYDAIQAEVQQQAVAFDKESADKYQQYLTSQADIVFQKNPTWRDPAVMQKEVSELANNAASEYGLTSKELDMIVDARQLAILQDAIAYRKGNAVVAKKMQEVPKFQKSNKGKTAQPADKLSQLMNRAKKATGASKRMYQTDAVAELLSS